MIGLIRKDVLNLTKVLKIYLGAAVLYSVFSYMNENTLMLVYMLLMLAFFLILSAFQEDDVCEWNLYAGVMPLKVTDIVWEKYLLGFIFNLGGVVCVLILSVILLALKGRLTEFPVILQSAGIGALVVITVQSIMIPVIYKMGVERARIAIIIGTFGIFFLGYAAIESGLLGSLSPELIENMIRYAPYAGIAAVLLLLIVSYKISVNLYKKKEW